MKIIEEYGPKNVLMRRAWVDCLVWAIGKDDIVQAFVEMTGITWRPPASEVEKMMGEETGAADARLVTFVKWFNENVWGEDESSPESEDKSVMGKIDGVQRPEDMSPDGFFRVTEQLGDFEIMVSGKDDMGEPSISVVRLCSVAMGGGKSPHTLAALKALMEAMAKDNEETPHRSGRTWFR